MRAPTFTLLLALAALACAPAAHASGPTCAWPLADDRQLLGDRSGGLERFGQMPQPCLEQLFRQCTRAAGATLLDFGSAARCSLGYEALLRKSFGGDFQALLAWWRGEAQASAPR